MNQGVRRTATALLAAIAVGCGGVVTPTEGDVGIDCNLPWSSMDEVESCASGGARVANMDSMEIDVLIGSKNPERIARALASVWLEHESMAGEIVVWGWSKPAVLRLGTGYDRGVVSEQGALGEKLVFEICTAWESLPGPGDLCGDTMEFTIDQ